jgi:hypothetical protein
MHVTPYTLVAATPAQVNQPQELHLSIESIIVIVCSLGGAVLSNAFSFLARNAVASAEKRIDQNALFLSDLQKQQYALERKVAEQYVDRNEFTHKMSVLDAHIEKLGATVGEQTVLLKSIETVLTERFSRGRD